MSMDKKVTLINNLWSLCQIEKGKLKGLNYVTRQNDTMKRLWKKVHII